MAWDRTNVKKILLATARVLVTAAVVALAVMGSRWLWIHYNVEPWTRDGRVRADVVEVSPDINGLVTDVRVKDGQAVRRGQVLFVIDQSRYELAERQAEAAVAADEASLAQARRDNQRNLALGTLVTTEGVEQGQAKVEELSAQLHGARVEHDLARLNLARTTGNGRLRRELGPVGLRGTAAAVLVAALQQPPARRSREGGVCREHGSAHGERRSRE
jgi:multidrug resistance efflux pump